MLNLDLHSLSSALGNLNGLAEALGHAMAQNKAFGFNSAPHSKDSAEFIAQTAASAEMPVTEAAAKRVKKLLEQTGDTVAANGYLIRATRDGINELGDAFRSECVNRHSIILQNNASLLYRQTDPLFGEAVSLKFAKVATDISEAGKCLALERPTASVFHLMRVVEFGVKRLGKKLGVEIDVENESWYQITLHVNKGVEKLPAKTDAQRRKKQSIAVAAAHLNAVRIATRNDVMHPKATYTNEEAQTLFDATKVLMQQMAVIA